MTEQENGAASKEPDKLSFLELVQSMAAGAIGVQSSKNRARDFNRGNAKVFIATGIITTLIFMGSVWAAVQLLLNQ